MRLEQIPLLLGLLVGVIGLTLVADALIPDDAIKRRERRRRARPGRHRGGEAALGFGVVAMAAALIGRDTWGYGTLAVLAAVILIGAGVALNWAYVSGLMLGPALSRGEPDDSPEEPVPPLPLGDRRKSPRG